jgi:hypothetical protein
VDRERCCGTQGLIQHRPTPTRKQVRRPEKDSSVRECTGPTISILTNSHQWTTVNATFSGRKSETRTELHIRGGFYSLNSQGHL